MKEVTVENCAEIIVRQHLHRKSLSNPYRNELDGLAWPGIVVAPSGREVLFDKTISSAAQDLADLLRRDVWSIGYYEWLNLVRESVAYALDAINPNTDFPIMARDFLDSVKSSLNQSNATIGSFEFAFGCTLFDGITPSPHCIGSVLLEARQDWLERKFADGAISSLMRQRLLRAWNSQPNRKRKRTRDSYIEKSILSMSNDAPFICSVTTNSMTFGFGRQRAKIAARLALTSIALLWNPTSKVLDKMNLVEDRAFRIINEISFQDKKIFCGNRKSHSPAGQKLTEDEWNEFRSNFSSHFAIVGSILNSITDPTAPPNCKKTIHYLTHALMWFYQGCREDEHVIAVIKFAAALDCLALGNYKKGIINLITSRTGIKTEQSLWIRGNQTAEEAVEEIYDYARNATLHGRKDDKKGRPDSMPFNDWEPARERAEALARYCLLTCIDWTAQNPGIDEPDYWRALTEA